MQPNVVTPSEVTTPVEEIVPGLTRQWMFDHQIVVYKGTSVSRQVIDAWAANVASTRDQWPGNLPYLAIHDMTSEEIGFTPYARARIEELFARYSMSPGHAAILLPRTFVSHVFQLFVRTQPKKNNRNAIFFSIEDALKWLKPKMASYSTPNENS